MGRDSQKSFTASHSWVKKRKKLERKAEGKSSLTVNGVMKEGGQEASDDLSGSASSSQSSEPSSNLDGCGSLRAEMSSSESCPPAKHTFCINSHCFMFSRPKWKSESVEVTFPEYLCPGSPGADPIPILLNTYLLTVPPGVCRF